MRKRLPEEFRYYKFDHPRNHLIKIQQLLMVVPCYEILTQMTSDLAGTARLFLGPFQYIAKFWLW